MSSPADDRAQALAKVEEAIGRSEQAITRQLITIAALERRGQDARHASIGFTLNRPRAMHR